MIIKVIVVWENFLSWFKVVLLLMWSKNMVKLKCFKEKGKEVRKGLRFRRIIN